MQASSEPGRILVVDDNRISRMILTRALRERGFEVATAEHGQGALALLKSNGNPSFDVVLLDVLMPVMDGYETLTEITRDPSLRHIPVIMISAVDEMDSAIRCIENGATDYLPRPYNPALLRARIGASLERKRLRDQEKVYLRALEREMEIGRQIQASFLPSQLPRLSGWEIAASFQAARQVAGDFYDVFPLQSGATLGLVIGDVCDKGVGAALFMTLFRSLIRALAGFGDGGPGSPTTSEGRARQLTRTVLRTNTYITLNHAQANMFATLFFAILDPATGDLTYINAGQEPPLILHAGGIKARLATTGVPVGLFAEVEYQAGVARLEPGEIFLGFSDGVIDAQDASGERFGRERLHREAEEPSPSARSLLDRIQARLNLHVSDAEPFDDITMLALRRVA
jgi:serine phosphatase RsbU (regulator of sigma subunit)